MKNLRWLALACLLTATTAVAQDMVLLSQASQSDAKQTTNFHKPAVYPGPCFAVFGTEAINVDDIYRVEIVDAKLIRIRYQNNHFTELSVPTSSTPINALLGTVRQIENCRKLKAENEQKGKVK